MHYVGEPYGMQDSEEMAATTFEAHEEESTHSDMSAGVTSKQNDVEMGFCLGMPTRMTGRLPGRYLDSRSWDGSEGGSERQWGRDGGEG